MVPHSLAATVVAEICTNRLAQPRPKQSARSTTLAAGAIRSGAIPNAAAPWAGRGTGTGGQAGAPDTGAGQGHRERGSGGGT